MLRSPIGMVDAAWRRMARADRGVQGGQGQAGVDPAADGVADDPPRPGVHDQGDVE